MQPDDPRHGTYAGWTAEYRDRIPHCTACTEAARRYGRRVKKNHRRGWRGHVPINKARNHIRALHDTGMTYQEIADASGIHLSTIRRVAGVDRPATKVSPRVALAILATQPTSERTGFVPVWRARRRLQALQALGWSLNTIGEHTGWTRSNLGALAADDTWRHRDTVARHTFEVIDATYQQLAMKVPPTNRWTSTVKQKALARGWVPPLAWDDIDDPNEKPYRSPRAIKPRRRTDIDHAVVERTLAGDYGLHTTPAEKREIVRRWIALDRPAAELYRKAGWKTERYYPTKEAS